MDLAAAADVILAQESSQGSWMELDGRPGLAPCLHFVQTLHREPTVYKYITLQMTWLKLQSTHSEREEREREEREDLSDKSVFVRKKTTQPIRDNKVGSKLLLYVVRGFGG